MEHHDEVRQDAHTENSADASSGRSQIVDMQLAVFDVAARSRGRDEEEITRMLHDEFSRRHVTPQTGLWLDAAATSAALGKSYIISNEALWGATEADVNLDNDAGHPHGR